MTSGTCTRALATLGGQGGGRFFRFQNTVEVQAGQSYVLDLAFNPVGAVYGGLQNAGGWGTEATYTDGTRVMVYPNLDVSPVLRTSAQKTVREQYRVAGITGVNEALIVDLYYAGETSNVGTGSIVGAQVRLEHTSSSTTLRKVFAVQSIETSGSAITLKNYAGTVIVGNLTRSTTSTTGGTQTVNVDQASMTASGGGSASSNVVTGTATFQGVTALTL
jgi:hypothetical protein